MDGMAHCRPPSRDAGAGVRVLVGRRQDALERRLAAERAAALLDVGDELVVPLVEVALHRARPRSRRARRATCPRSGRRPSAAARGRPCVASPPRSSRGAAPSSASPRGRACTCRRTRACRTSSSAARAAPCSSARRPRSARRRRRTSRSRPASRSRAARRSGRGGQRRHRRAAGDDRLQLVAAGDPAGVRVDQLAHRGAELELVVARASRRCRRSRRARCPASSACRSGRTRRRRARGSRARSRSCRRC